MSSVLKEHMLWGGRWGGLQDRVPTFTNAHQPQNLKTLNYCHGEEDEWFLHQSILQISISAVIHDICGSSKTHFEMNYIF